MSEIVKNNEALHLDLFAQNLAHQPVHAIRPTGQLCSVILRDQPANWHPCVGVQQRDNSIQHLAANILKIDVDAIRGDFAQQVPKVTRLMINASNPNSFTA